jgi:ABC-2 type transport system ATP-binding protein
VTAAELVEVTKRFGASTAVDRVSFSVEVGEVVALLGPNGAGKTTSLALLLGLRRPDSGRAVVFGGDPRAASVRRAIGVTPQEVGCPHALRVAEVIGLVRAHYPQPLPKDEILDRFGLTTLAQRQIGGLSGGERRRLAVALAFAGGPPLVVLDEPTAGLDGDSRRAVWDAVRRHAAAGGSVLLTTHHLDEAEALATRVIVIESGRLVAAGEVAAIKGSVGLTRVSFSVPPNGFDCEGAERDGERVALLVRDAGDAVARLVHEGVRLDELEVRPVTLEEAVTALRERR